VRLRACPLTPERWGDLERLFGPERGACAGCWCMWFKLGRSEWAAVGRDGRKRAFRELLDRGGTPGLLGYAGDEPVGWVAVEPRSAYPVIERSRVGAPVDDRPAWAITCFYLAPRWRRRGLMHALAGAAVQHARAAGAEVIEAYPLDPPPGERKTGAFVGLASVFRAIGFTEVARRTPLRPLLRLIPSSV
jgi:GNAT superfamily N-acetyltransferase